MYIYIYAFTTTYNPKHPDVFKYMATMKEGLKNSDRMKKIVSSYRWIKSYKQAPNLKRILCKSEFSANKQDENKNKVSMCKDPRCGTCPYIKETSSIKFSEDNDFKIAADMNCASNNLIYCIFRPWANPRPPQP